MTLYRKLIGIARKEIRRHIEYDDGEKCFNRYTYLEALPTLLPDDWLGFCLNRREVARFLYCCLDGETDDGNKYRGMPILD